MNNQLWNKGKALMYHAIRSMYLQLLNTKLWVLSLLQIQVDDQHFDLILGKAVIILGFRLFSNLVLTHNRYVEKHVTFI